MNAATSAILKRFITCNDTWWGKWEATYVSTFRRSSSIEKYIVSMYITTIGNKILIVLHHAVKRFTIVKIECCSGFISWYTLNKVFVGIPQVDAIVNSTSTDLDLSRNASAIALSAAAGPMLQQECKAIGKVNAGDIVVTSGANLNCKQVFHTSCAGWNQQSGEQVQNNILHQEHRY